MDEYCKKKINQFCFVCSLFTVPNYQIKIDVNIIKLYKKCFKISMRNLDSDYSPDIICKICKNMMLEHDKNNKPLSIQTPAIWRDPRNHSTECFCNVKTFGYSQNQRKTLNYNYGHCCTAPTFRSKNVQESESTNQIFESTSRLQDIDSLMGNLTINENLSFFSGKTENYDETFYINQPMVQNKIDLKLFNDFVRAFDHRGGKKASASIGKFLHDFGLLKDDVKWTSMLDREKEVIDYFGELEDGSPYCRNVAELVETWFGFEYKPEDFRLFLDSGKGSFKCVLLHNDGLINGIPLLYSTTLNENQEDIELVLESVNYFDHQWIIICDIKMIGILSGIKVGNCSFPCFLCDWRQDCSKTNKFQKYNSQETRERTSFEIGQLGVKGKQLVDPKKILFPPLHIKLGIFTQFVLSLQKDGVAIDYLKNKFPRISESKIEHGILDGSKIKKIFKDQNFKKLLTKNELNAWNSFISLCDNFLGINRSRNYKAVVTKFLDSFQKQGIKETVKIHFLSAHLNYFPDNVGKLSDEQGERFHQEVSKIEKRYQGRWNKTMLADYVWLQKKETNYKFSYINCQN